MHRRALFFFLLAATWHGACRYENEPLDLGSDDLDGMISDVSAEVHEKVNTVLEISWLQKEPADQVWVRYTFENNEWHESPAKSGDIGFKKQAILGLPGDTDVAFNIVAKVKEKQQISSDYSETTGSVPGDMPVPTVESFKPSLASSNRWLFGSVDDTPAANKHYFGPFWLYIIDRQGRIVWYYSDLADNPIIGFPRISRDNRYIYFGNRTPWHDSYGFVPTLVKMTLDYSYFEEIDLNLWDNVDMTDDGSLLYNSRCFKKEDSWLRELAPNGDERDIWNCTKVYGNNCYSNTVNWNQADDTVLMSFPYINTVVEIDRKSGKTVRLYGDLGTYDFSPSTWEFEFQHYADITPDGTLMVSSHMPNSKDRHAFVEFEIDKNNEVLEEKWVYNEGDEWPKSMGEAYVVGNGSDNVLANYGTAGVILEITKDKQVAWRVKFDADFTDDKYNKMVGHCTLLNDLYALLKGP